MKKYQHVIVSFLLLLSIVSCESNKEYIYNEGLIFGTIYHVTYKHNKDLSDTIKSLLDAFDMSMSTYKEGSVISRINKNESDKTDVYFREVFNCAKEITAATNGAFDITVAPLVNVWGFGFSKQDSVTPGIIDSIKQDIGMDMVWLEGDRVVKRRSGIMFDASAIAKGYAVDVVADLFDSFGIENYMVEIGGEMRLKGRNPENKKWQVGIDKPIDDLEVRDRQLQEIIGITDIALATSGNYRNFYIKGGKKYAHTISPYSGYPVNHNLLGVSVLAPDCMTADAYATAFMVLGLEKSLEVIETHPELEAYFITAGSDQKYEVYATDGFSKFIVDRL